MASLVQRNFYTTCPGELLEYINDDVTITTELFQIISTGQGSPIVSDFWFDSAPSAPELTRLDEILYTEGSPPGWECSPPPQNQVDLQELDDTGGPDSSVIWSSDKIQTELNDKSDDPHTHTESDITDLGNYAVIGGAHHDGFSDFVANEHINHTSVSINSGGILSGGGDLTATRTITLNHSDVDHDQTTNFVAQEHIRWDLTGAEDVHDDRVAAGAVTQHEGSINHDNLLGFVANEHINHTSVTLTAGAGLAGGGDISANRTFSVNVQNSIEISTDTLQLVNDEASPGNDKLYGTNGSGVKGWYDQSSGGVFGQEYANATSNGPSTTTSTTFQTKLTLTATGLTAGYTYCVAFSSVVGSLDDDKHMDARITIGGTEYQIIENSGKTGSTSTWNFSGTLFFTGLSGSQDIDLDYRMGPDGGTALMKQAYIQIWRVS